MVQRTGRFVSTTADSWSDKKARVMKYILDPRNAHMSNRELARLAEVDEKTIRRHRKVKKGKKK